MTDNNRLEDIQRVLIELKPLILLTDRIRIVLNIKGNSIHPEITHIPDIDKKYKT